MPSWISPTSTRRKHTSVHEDTHTQPVEGVPHQHTVIIRGLMPRFVSFYSEFHISLGILCLHPQWHEIRCTCHRAKRMMGRYWFGSPEPPLSHARDGRTGQPHLSTSASSSLCCTLSCQTLPSVPPLSSLSLYLLSSFCARQACCGIMPACIMDLLTNYIE